jgi:hypothetical protein
VPDRDAQRSDSILLQIHREWNAQVCIADLCSETLQAGTEQPARYLLPNAT